MRPVPPELRNGPFSLAQARALGVTSRHLTGRRYVRVHPAVWRHVDHVMTPDDTIRAAQLALPADAHLTGISRLQRAGLDHGPRTLVRFVVARDHHLDVDGVILHRTQKLPALVTEGVTVPMAFIACCSRARTVDAIKVGDWLLHEGLTSTAELTRLSLAEPWRAGALETVWVIAHLDAASRTAARPECGGRRAGGA